MMILKIIAETGKLQKFVTFIQKLIKDQPKLLSQFYAFFGEHLIKHSSSGVDRGRIVQTFRKMGIDLSKHIKDTTRLPTLKSPISEKELAEGLKQFVLPQGQRLKLPGSIVDQDRFMADLMSDKRYPFAQYFADEMKKLR